MPPLSLDNQYGRSTLFATVVMVIVSIAFVAIAVGYPRFAKADPYNTAPPQAPPPEPPRIIIPPQAFIPIPIPINPISVPTDVTGPFGPYGSEPPLGGIQGTQPTQQLSAAAQWALSGIVQIPDSSFPPDSALKGSTEGITVKWLGDKLFEQPNPFTVVLQEGATILLSVKKPSEMAMVKIPGFGSVSIKASGDVLLVYSGGTLHTMNLTGQNIVAQLNQGPFAGPADPTVQVAAGYELVAATHKLTRQDMRPKDGIARRHFKVLENGHLAISEFSIESAINNSELIAELQSKASGAKERRILGDMSKMAAVLNHKSGTKGYSAEK